MKIERNMPCPCGSGKKFKKCHLGKEDELQFDEPESITEEASKNVTSLPKVEYGKAKELIEALDVKSLTGADKGIKFIDLKSYSNLSFFGPKLPDEKSEGSGSVFINIYKTEKSDPDNIYIAISPGVSDSVLAHQVAHALDYFGGSKIMPGFGRALSMEFEVPVEHVEHSMEFGKWLDHLQKDFQLKLDADDTIILYLYHKEKLLTGEDILSQDATLIKKKSNDILLFLSQNGPEINRLIQEKPGYIGSQIAKD